MSHAPPCTAQPAERVGRGREARYAPHFAMVGLFARRMAGHLPAVGHGRPGPWFAHAPASLRRAQPRPADAAPEATAASGDGGRAERLSCLVGPYS
jgi:hypothetical protein